tara:strand:+ start:1247 stop:1663 length:417 start_codon:yes stop_codon:yes gene_type:complete
MGKDTELALAPKTIGEIGELRFCANALERGIVVCSPHGDNQPYDYVTVHGGQLLRVQVKSATTGNSSNSDTMWGAPLKRGAGGKYESGSYDVLVFYIIPDDITYLVPEIILRGKSKLTISYTEGTKYEKYRDAWDLLM